MDRGGPGHAGDTRPLTSDLAPQGVGTGQGSGVRRPKSKLGLRHSGDLGATLDESLPLLWTWASSDPSSGHVPWPPASLAAYFLGTGCVHLSCRVCGGQTTARKLY